MEYLHENTVTDLLGRHAVPKVTIYVPTINAAAPPKMAENQLRIKNLLLKAANQLRAQGGDAKLADLLMRQAAQFNEDVTFWNRSLTYGMLICASPEEFRTFYLPTDTEEYVAVDDQYHLAPILSIVGNEQPFYLLSLALNGPRLYEGDMYGLHPLEAHLPESMESALRIDEVNQKTHNRGSAGGVSINTRGYNGRGGVTKRAEAERLRYFRLLDKAVRETADTSRPLVLAGTETDVAQYRSISAYPRVMTESLHGNFTAATEKDMFEKAYPIVWREAVEPARQAAIEEYQALSGMEPGKVAQTEPEILEAASMGKIDKLLVATTNRTADTVRDDQRSVMRIAFPERRASRLLNKIAATVWQMKGKIIGLSEGRMPGGALAAATLRY